MRARGMRLALALGLAFGPSAALAADDDVQEALKQVQDRLSAVEDQLEAANTRVAEQEKLIQSSGLAPVDSGNKLTTWINSLEFDGWVSATYWYNFNDVDNDALVGGNKGVFGQSNPFNPDANQFSFDQLWFSFGKPVTEDSRAGFWADIVYGKVAGLLPFGNAAEGGNSLYLGNAYVQYLTPFGPTVKMGKFATLLGAEVAQAPLNWNISRGLVYNVLEPIDHTGILLTGPVGESGFDYGFGVVNDVFKSQSTVSNGKAYLARVGYTGEGWSLGMNTIYGAMSSSIGPPGDEEARGGIVNLLFKHDPTESFSWYVNYDYSWRDGDYDEFSGATGHGISVAGRYAITERLGAALRAEYVTTDEGFLLEREVNLWGLTGTIDYALTEQLTVKAELRWDQGSIRRAPDDLYPSNHSGLEVDEDDAAVIGVEAIYRF
jgi:hypothetical protein